MELRTDDEVFRTRLVYLGPPGYTLPFQFTYAQYGVFTALAVVFFIVGAALLGPLSTMGPAIALAYASTYYIWRHVDYEVTARNAVAVMARDWRPLRAAPDPQPLPRMTARHIVYRTTILEEGQ